MWYFDICLHPVIILTILLKHLSFLYNKGIQNPLCLWDTQSPDLLLLPLKPLVPIKLQLSAYWSIFPHPPTHPNPLEVTTLFPNSVRSVFSYPYMTENLRSQFVCSCLASFTEHNDHQHVVVMIVLPCLLRLNSSPSDMHSTFSLSIYQLVNTYLIHYHCYCEWCCNEHQSVDASLMCWFHFH